MVWLLLSSSWLFGLRKPSGAYELLITDFKGKKHMCKISLVRLVVCFTKLSYDNQLLHRTACTRWEQQPLAQSVHTPASSCAPRYWRRAAQAKTSTWGDWKWSGDGDAAALGKHRYGQRQEEQPGRSQVKHKLIMRINNLACAKQAAALGSLRRRLFVR